MLERFLARYPLPPGAPATEWSNPMLVGVVGYPEFAASAVGLPLCGGMLRVATETEGLSAQEFIGVSFPHLAQRAVPFAIDWLGRVFAVDLMRVPGLLLVEPGSGMAFDIDESFVDFFNIDLVDDPDTYVASDFFNDWRSHGGRVPTINECIGFKVPLFLGGAGTVDNLEPTDLDVYWSFAGQLRGQAAGWQPGTQIGGVEAVDPSPGDIPAR